ncbi:UNVERIFIED_CONTAM: putative conserved protein (some members containing a von Willebrand factor type A (vWA) domain) [Acetivibrio alkalicellulosi]
MLKILAYVLMTGFFLLYTYVFGSDTSMLMLYVLILLPIFSTFFVYPVSRRLEVSIQVPTLEVEKDGLAEVKVLIKNKSFIPTPFIDISFIEAPNFNFSHDSDITVFLKPMETKSITVGYTPKCRGVSKIGVKSIVLKDYMGFIKLSLLKSNTELQKEIRHMGELTVLPKLVHIKPSNKILKNTNDANSPEETNNLSNNFYSWGGQPGYEFRQYVPGDSLHKIHWKLSAKSDVLMVRKDEESGTTRKLLIIDPYITYIKTKQEQRVWWNLSRQKSEKWKEEKLIIEEKLLEAVLAIANINVIFGNEIEVWMLEKERWVNYLITDKRNINHLQHKMAQYKFMELIQSQSHERIPLLDIMAQDNKKRYSKIGEAIIFTGNYNLPTDEISKFLEYGFSLDMVIIKNSQEEGDTGQNSTHSNVENLWVIDTNEDLNQVFL